MGILKVTPVMMSDVHGNLCTMEYYNHKKGCPNFNKKNGCPPNVKRFDKLYDMEKDVYVIYNIFLFGHHVRRMKLLHSDWTQKQAECCLYWQGKARKYLNEQILQFKLTFGNEYEIEKIPEAMGVNVTDTMANAGHFLEWPPKSITYQIALAAHLKESSQ